MRRGGGVGGGRWGRGRRARWVGGGASSVDSGRDGRASSGSSLLLRLLRRHLLRMARLAERDVDRVGTIEERDGRPRAQAKLLPHFQQRFILGMRFQSLLHGFDRLLAISGGHIDTGQVRVVIDVVELQLDGALAEIDGRLEFLLPQRPAKSDVRNSGRALRPQPRGVWVFALCTREADRPGGRRSLEAGTESEAGSLPATARRASSG